MALDFDKLCRDRGIDISPKGGKHTRKGWINVSCPHCEGHDGFHLGYNAEKDYLKCWRCGWHRKEETICALFRCTYAESKSIIKKYYTRNSIPHDNEIAIDRDYSKQMLPSGCGPMTRRHKAYLESRELDPDVVEPLWGLLGTGPVSDRGYSHRIIAPIRFDSQVVSWQGRDITDKSPLRYKACPRDCEIIQHQQLLYGFDLVRGDSIVIVEGIVDAWKLGPGAVATFGIEYSISQVRLLHPFKNRFIIFDSDEPTAQEKAESLAAELGLFSGEVEIIDLGEGDPGAMKISDAKSLMRELGMRG